MMGRRVFGRGVVALVVGGMALALSGCSIQSETYRYRLTVEVDTPEGVKTGSSVIEVQVSETGKDALVTPEASGINSKYKGEAVAVDLGDGRYLFALLRGESYTGEASRIAAAAFNPPRYGNEVDYNYLERIRDMKNMDGVAEVPRDAWPMLVSFGDLADPTSVELVDLDDLPASFGEGVSLRRITVQMTDDPVTTGIEKRLGWLNSYRDLHFDGTSTVSEDLTTADLRAHLTAGSFSTEFAQ